MAKQHVLVHPNDGVTPVFCKACDQLIFENTTTQEPCIPFTPQVVAWFTKFRNSDEYECMDNYRFAHLADPIEVAHFDVLRERGCCGSVEETLMDPTTSELLLVGFNYGH